MKGLGSLCLLRQALSIKPSLASDPSSASFSLSGDGTTGVDIVPTLAGCFNEGEKSIYSANKKNLMVNLGKGAKHIKKAAK